MKVIVFASSKGGVGKTTLAFNVGIHAARAGAGVQLLDRDPQRSLLDLCLRRRDTPELVADNPMILQNAGTVGQTVSDLRESGYDRDYLIVDTPGSLMDVLREAIAAADVVVVPLQPSPLDFLAQEDVGDQVDRMGKRDRTLFVINRADARSPIVAATMKAIKPRSPNHPVRVANRIAYATAALTARGAVETSSEAAAEIKILWNSILKIARQSDEHEVSRRHGSNKAVRAS